MSIFIAKFPPKHFLSSTLTASEAKAIQSLMFLPLMKPFCSLDMVSGKILAYLSASTFVMILNLKLASAIGLYCSMVSALGL